LKTVCFSVEDSFESGDLSAWSASTTGGMTTSYTLDLAAGLTQVLVDGTYTYLYGVDRLAQFRLGGVDYFLGDALGSVRQLVDGNGAVTLAKSYQPYGELYSSTGSGVSGY
jgi:hypothetical protein